VKLDMTTYEGGLVETAIQAARSGDASCRCVACVFLRAIGQALEVPELEDDDEDLGT